MNKKRVTYLVGIVVIAVWGKIIFDVFQWNSNPDEAWVPPVQQVQMQIDTSDYSLSLDYRDPFLGKTASKKRQSNPISSASNNKRQPKPVEPVVQTSWPKITYQGLVSNNVSGSKKGILLFNGQTKFVELNEEFSGIQVAALTADSILLSYNNNTRTYAR